MLITPCIIRTLYLLNKFLLHQHYIAKVLFHYTYNKAARWTELSQQQQQQQHVVALVVAFVNVLWIMNVIEHYNSGSFV